MKYIPDTTSRFRILKGGRISLVVSALLVGSSVVGTGLYAVDDVTTPEVATRLYDYSGGGDTDVSLLVSTGSIAVTGAGVQTAVEIIRPTTSTYNTTITNNNTISADSTNSYSSTAISIKGDSAGHTTGDVSITNTGTISATTAGTGYGAYIAYHDSIMHILNDTAGTIYSSSFGLSFKDTNLQAGSTITNNGSISINNPNGSGAGLIFNNSSNTNIYESSIINNGTIAVTASGTAYGMNLQYFEGSSLSNTANGSISALSDNQNADGVYVRNFYNSTGTNATISNSGLIHAETTYGSDAKGIYVINNNGTQLNGEITNHAGNGTTTGVISAQADNGTAKGIDLYAYSVDGLTLTNSGTISATAGNGGNEAYGVQFHSNNDLYVSNTTIENQLGAEISASSINSNAIGVDFNAGNYLYLNSTSLTNFGTISAEVTDSSAYGIRMYGGSGAYITDTSITNSGTISALAGDNGRAYGIYTGNMYGTSHITNSGMISAEAGYQGSARAINVRDMRGTSYISNAATKTISAEAGDNGDAQGIRIGNMNDTTHITNSGTISALVGNNSNAYGLNIGSMGDSSYISNNSGGEIKATVGSNGTAKGIYVQNLDASITNDGTISATADNNSDAYGIMINYSNSSGVITNNGTITATISAQADSAAFSLKTQGQINVNNTSSGNLNGNLSVIGTLTNDGAIRLPYNATNAFVTTFVNNGTLQIGLLTDGTLGGTTHSTLNADDATFNNGSTIDVNVLAASTHSELLVDQTIQDVVAATNSLTINGTLNVTDNSALLNFEYVQDGNTIDLNVVQGTTILDSAVAGGGNSNAQAVASALQAIQDAGSYPEMDSFFSALNGLSSDAEIASAVESTTPAATNASSSATTQIMNGVQGMVEMRQNTMMGTGGMNSGDINLVDKNLWVKLFGSRGSQDKKDGINGFDVKAHGLGIGADAEISPRQRIGAALFYTDASVDVNNMPQTSDLKVYSAIVYGNVPVNTNTDFLYQAGYSWQKTESDRTILPTYDHAKADYTSRTASLNLKLMQSYNLRNDLTVHPLVETTYRHYINPSYSESGAGALNLQIDKFTSSQFVTGGGAIFDYKLDKDSKVSTDLRVGYDWHHNAQTVTSSYQGASGVDFTTSGIDNGGWQYDIGLGYETAKLLDGELEFMYNYQAQGSSFRNNVFSAKYTYKF